MASYEENRHSATDKRDAVQKKTFTKWVNKHIVKCQLLVEDLYTDLRDGNLLLTLLEILSQEYLPHEKGRLRFHQLQNVKVALDFLASKGIRTVNIRPDEIVDGNPKLTLGLIWTIILHFQVSDVVVTGYETGLTAREALLLWSQRTTAGYPDVKVSNFTRSWTDGKAFLAILHRNRPDLVDYSSCRQRSARQNLEMAFNIAEQKLGVTKLLDPEDVDLDDPDEKSLITYISSLYDVFPEVPPLPVGTASLTGSNIGQVKWDEYKSTATKLVTWLKNQLTRLEADLPNSYKELKHTLTDENILRNNEIPRMDRERQRLDAILSQLKSSGVNVDSDFPLSRDLHTNSVAKLWEKFIAVQSRRLTDMQALLQRLQELEGVVERVVRDTRSGEDTLKDIEGRVKELSSMGAEEARGTCESIERTLKGVESSVSTLLRDTSMLTDAKHPKAAQLHNNVIKLKDHLQSITLRWEPFASRYPKGDPWSGQSTDRKSVV